MTVQHDDATGSAHRAAGPPPTAEDLVLARLEGLPATYAAHPDPAFRTATRTRLVAMAAVREPAPRHRGLLRRDRRTGTPAWRGRLTAGLAGATLTLTALGGLLTAAQGAGPGDLLYQVKRGGEATQLVLAGDSTRGSTLLDFARTRLGELTELAGTADAGPVVETLRTMDRQTSEGAAWLTTRAVAADDATGLRTLTAWTAGQRAGLDALADEVPTDAAEALASSQQLLSAVADRAAALDGALACSGGPSVAAGDELGPLPVPCRPGPPATGSPAPATPPAPPVSSVDAPAAPGGVVPPAAPPAPATTPPPVPTAAPAPAPAPSPDPSPPAPAPEGQPVPPAPAAPTTAAPDRPSTVVELPPVVPGLRVCLPPLISLNCRPAAD
ncbi:DUF5667 domain-containing protein [Modestobacter sp. SYSU DS0290]